MKALIVKHVEGEYDLAREVIDGVFLVLNDFDNEDIKIMRDRFVEEKKKTWPRKGNSDILKTKNKKGETHWEAFVSYLEEMGFLRIEMLEYID